MKKIERGSTLLIALVMLALLTFISLSNIELSTFEEKASGNMRDSLQSFESAEHALRDGETWLNGLTAHPTPVTACLTQPCVISQDPTVLIENQTSTWWTNQSATVATAVTGVSTQPRYVIEYLRFVPDSVSLSQTLPTGRYFYRITARATGATNNTVTILQSTYARRY